MRRSVNTGQRPSDVTRDTRRRHTPLTAPLGTCRRRRAVVGFRVRLHQPARSRGQRRSTRRGGDADGGTRTAAITAKLQPSRRIWHRCYALAHGARRLSRGGRRAEPSDAQEAGTRRECADGPARSRLRAHNRAHRHGRRHGRGVWICIAGGPVIRQRLLPVGLLPQVRVLAVVLVLQSSCHGLVILEHQVPDRVPRPSSARRGSAGWGVVGRRRGVVPRHPALAV